MDTDSRMKISHGAGIQRAAMVNQVNFMQVRLREIEGALKEGRNFPKGVMHEMAHELDTGLVRLSQLEELLEQARRGDL